MHADDAHSTIRAQNADIHIFAFFLLLATSYHSALMSQIQTNRLGTSTEIAPTDRTV